VPGPWGASDALGRPDGAVLTSFAAVDWQRLDRIPPLAEPARLPPGAGTAVLNLIARLAAEQGAQVLRYDGPYPTEQLFLALLESFAWRGDHVGDPLEAFMRGALVWAPAPHTRAFEPCGVYVQRRARVEKIVAGGRAYYRPEWQGVRRRTSRVVRDADDGVRASLVVLGIVLEDHVRLDVEGSVVAVPPVTADVVDEQPVPAAVLAGIVAILVARSAAPLGPFLRRAAGPLRFAWAPVAADAVHITRDRVDLSPRVLRALARRLAQASTRAERLGAALAALSELADLLGDELRRRAQAALAAADASTQAAALATPVRAPDEADARAIAAAAEALLAAAAQLA
jgi:hypothetical protein